MLGRQPGAGQDLLDRGDDPGIVDLASRQVDLDRSPDDRTADGGASGIGAVLPVAQLVACLLQHPGPDGDDQPALLGHRDETTGGDQALGRMLPSDERLHSHRGELPELHHRLVVEHQLAALEGPVQRVLGGHPIDDLDPHGLAEGLDPRSSPLLGPVHGGLGIGQQR